MKVAICTYHSAGYAALADVTLPNKFEYAKRHGYYVVPMFDRETKWRGWDRIRMVAEALKTYDVAVWMDCDAIFTNFDRTVEDFLSHGRPFVYTADMNGLNSGVFIMCREALVRQFLGAILVAGPALVRDHPWAEQEAMIRFLAAPPYHGLGKCIEPQHLFMGYLLEELHWPDYFQGQWTEESWTLHLPGMPNMERRIELMKQYVQVGRPQ